MTRLGKREKIFICLTILWLCVMWGHSLTPAVESDKESLGVVAILNSFLPFEITNHMVRKTAHFSEYFILGVLSTQIILNKVRENIMNSRFSLLFVFFVAFIDETIQLFVEGRSGQISDVWLDFSGGLVAIILTCVIIKLRHK